MKYISLILLILFVTSCSRCISPYMDNIPCGYIEQQECTDVENDILVYFWNEFNDPLLSYLIEEAFCANRDYLTAQEKVVEVRASYISELSRLLPQVDALFSATRERNSLTTVFAPFDGGQFFSLFEAGLLASWELDFFGKRRDRARAAYYDIASNIASKYALKLLIASEIATNYMSLTASYELIAVNKKHVEIQQQLFDIANDRFNAGIATEKDACNARSILERRKAAVYLDQILVKENLYSIAHLIGRTPQETYCLFNESLQVPTPSKTIPCTFPSDLLSRRPDIREAEYDLLAAGARVSASRKELFPTISLLGFYIYESSFFKSLFTEASRAWQLTSLATMPIFHGGGIYADIEINTSRQRQAVYQYEDAVLTALKDVETAMTLYFEEEKRLKHLKEAIVADTCALDISRARYEAGIIDFNNVMDDALNLHDDEILEVESKRSLMVGLVLIYKSLGGGWDWSCLP